MKINFFLPIKNEGKILEKNTLKLLNYCLAQNYNFAWEIIIAINGSTDNSLIISKKLTKKFKDKINYINYKKPGRGSAIKNSWLNSDADIVLYMDIDMAVSLDNINNLLNPIIKNKTDLAIGSRLLPDSKIKRSFIREFVSRNCNFFYRLFIGHKISDTQCGFKAIKKNVFYEISPYINDNNWFFDTEVIAFTQFLGYKIKEVPVNWEENRYDKRKSKVNLIKDSFIHFINLINLRWRIKKLLKKI